MHDTYNMYYTFGEKFTNFNKFYKRTEQLRNSKHNKQLQKFA